MFEHYLTKSPKQFEKNPEIEPPSTEVEHQSYLGARALKAPCLHRCGGHLAVIKSTKTAASVRQTKEARRSLRPSLNAPDDNSQSVCLCHFHAGAGIAAKNI